MKLSQEGMSYDLFLLKDEVKEIYCVEVSMEDVPNNKLEPEFNNLKNYFAHIMVETQV
jgi:hypothetical protein